MKVSTEIDNNFGYEKITQLVDNIPLTKPEKVLIHSKTCLNRTSVVQTYVFTIDRSLVYTCLK